MISSAEKTIKSSPTLQQKAAGNSFFRKAGEESFFGAKQNPSFFGKPLQPKLTVSTPDDPQEKEADAVADKVMRMQQPVMASTPPEKKEEKLERKEEEELQAKQETAVINKIHCKETPEEKLNPKSGNVIHRVEEEQVDAKRETTAEMGAGHINPKNISLYPSDVVQQSGRGPPTSPIPFEQTLASSKGGGSELPGNTRTFMESRFNADFSGVRIHTDHTAQHLSSSVNAQAFAHGNDIYFNNGKFAPHSAEGSTLLAHELAHTIQQGASGINKSPVRHPLIKSKGIIHKHTNNEGAPGSGAPCPHCSNAVSIANKTEGSTFLQNTSPVRIQSKCACCQNESNQLQLKEQPPAASVVSPPSQQVPPTGQTNQPAGTAASAPTVDAPAINAPPQTTQNKKETALAETPGKSKDKNAGPPGSPASSAKENAKPGSKAGTGPAKAPAKPGSNDAGPVNKDDPKEGAAGSPAADLQLDSSSSQGLLQSIAAVPASSFVVAVGKSKSLATQVQSHEKADLGSSLPEVEQPTGLPRLAGQDQRAVTNLPPGAPPDLNNAGARTGQEPELKHQEAEGPLPAANVSTAVSAAPADDGGGSWWSWLMNQVQNFLGSIPTQDQGLSTSAGPRPNVDLSGDADPAQTAQNKQASEEEVTNQKTNADQATTVTFGENGIYPTVPVKQLKASYKPGAPIAGKAANAPKTPVLSEKMRATFDQHETPELNAKSNEQLAHYQQEQDKYHQESELTRQQGHQRIEDETGRTRLEQQGMQQQAKEAVNAERQSWREENSKIHEQYASQSEEKRQEIDGQVKEKVQSSEKEADQKLSEAEQKADTERQKTEREAAAKKQEEENKPHSFWDSVKDAVSSVFDALRKVVDGLFDALRSLVKGIIEAAKAVVHTIIEAARSVIVGLIKGFGIFLKGLVSVALAAFPAAAAKARAWIDKHVDQAVDAVNAAANKLEKAADAALDWVGETLDKALSVLQAAFNAILDVLEFLTKGLVEIMELLTNLDELIKKVGGFINGLIDLMENPGKIEAAAKETVKGYIDQIPGKVQSTIEGFLAKGGAPEQKTAAPAIQKKDDPAAAKKEPSGIMKHLEGIWKHLKPGLEHIKANWWTEIKQMLWNMVWPFNDKSPLKKDATELYHLPGKILDSIWDHKFSQAVDQFLLMQQKLNSVIGLFYGWFFIASVLVGAIVGSIVPGPGTLAGAAAGAAFAGEVGEGLLLAMIATETEVIVKAVYDLAFGPGTVAVNESAYDRIASSGLTLGITAVFMVLSEIASEIASELVSGVKGLFKGEVPEAPGVKIEGPEAEGGTPEAKGDTPEAKDLGMEGGKKVLAEEPIPGGETVKVTEDGECEICRSCEDSNAKNEEIKKEGDTPALDDKIKEFDGIDGKTNPEAKAAKEAEIIKEAEGEHATKENEPVEDENKPTEPETPLSRIQKQILNLKARAFELLRRFRELMPNSNPEKFQLEPAAQNIMESLKELGDMAENASPDEIDQLIKPEAERLEGELAPLEDQAPKGPLEGEKTGQPGTNQPKAPQGEFKKPRSGLSGKEGATDIPSWAEGKAPKIGETGEEFAQRILDDKYGKGNYDRGADSEFNKIQKYGDRHFE